MNNDMLPVGTTFHIKPEDIKWEQKGDLISREALKKAIEPYRYAMCGFEGVLFLIDNAPAVEYTFEEAFQKTVCEQRLYCPARPQGEWKMIGTIGLAYKCNKCGEVIVVPTNFCPNCGAKMKGGAEE